MNRKRTVHILDKEFHKWTKSIEDTKVRDLAEKHAYITGGAIVSLFDNKKPNDLDIYFQNFETARAVTKYYVDRWNAHHDTNQAVVDVVEGESVKVFIRSHGIAEDAALSDLERTRRGLGLPPKDEKKEKDEKPYKPVFLSANAITLSDGVQIINRFFGSPEEVHKNFDFVHCTNSYYPYKRELKLPSKALESYIYKELKYIGSRYPIASILRTRKFINRGYKINAGQYLKMVFQLQQFDLTNPTVLADQLNGVDLLYMRDIINTIESDQINDPELKIDSHYLVQVVEKIFDKDLSYDSRLDEDMDEHIEEGGQ
jgi:hypothetical protein